MEPRGSGGVYSGTLSFVCSIEWYDGASETRRISPSVSRPLTILRGERELEQMPYYKMELPSG